MRALSQTGAHYFCTAFSAAAVSSARDMDELLANALKGKKNVTENTPLYPIYRDTLLREAERAFFLGVACFRRAHDILLASSSFWAHVTLYYTSWFAAHSILELFGCWAGGLHIGVQHDMPGQQAFELSPAPSGGKTHQIFWSTYYSAMAPLRNWIDPSLNLAIDPVNSNVKWQIENRNRINYRTFEALDLVGKFDNQFDPSNFPMSLPGETATQYEVAKTTILLAAHFIISLRVNTDAFAALRPGRQRSIDELIFNAPIPNISSFAEQSRLAV